MNQAGSPGLLDYVAGFWRYRMLPNLLFLHYDDMSDDLEGEMARLANFLGIARSPNEIKALCEHARFDRVAISEFADGVERRMPMRRRCLSHRT